MTQKQKPQTIVQFPPYSLRNEFTLHSPLPIEQCADNLREIEFPVKSLFEIRSQAVELRVIDDNTLSLHVRRKRRNRTIDTTMAQVKGNLIDNGDGTTTISGIAWMSYWYALFLAIPALMAISYFYLSVMLPTPLGAILMQFILLAGVSYGYWQLYRDRRDMMADIVEAVGVVPGQQGT